MKTLNSNDIAKLAGVSRSTVSRVINGYPNVNEETRAKVEKIIKENDYYPLLSGRLLRGNRIDTLGLFWNGKYTLSSSPLNTTFFMQMIEAASRRGYSVLSNIQPNLTDQKNASSITRIFQEGRIDAGLFVGVSNNEPLIDSLVNAGKIVGIFDYYREDENYPNRITVNFDRSSGEKAVDYLYSLGHRKIAVIDGDMSHISCVHRHESFLKGFMKHHLSIRNKWMVYGGITLPQGYKAAIQMLKQCEGNLPTAICTNNDSAALGTYQACAELGLRIPEDISIIGIDGDPVGANANPPLTTLSIDFHKMFSSLVDRVIDTIEQKENVPQSEFIESVLVERGSCKPLS